MAICETCEKRESVGVACIPGMPVSVGYCRECLIAGAHPPRYLAASVAICGGLEQMAPEYKKLIQYTLNHLHMSWDKFNQLVAANKAVLEGDDNAE
jgi:hypothetical protein